MKRENLLLQLRLLGNQINQELSITFKPDGTIFQTTEFNFEILSARLRELAFLNKGILLTIKDMRELVDDGNGGTPRYEEFRSEAGT